MKHTAQLGIWLPMTQCFPAAPCQPQGRNIDRVFTVTYLPITLCLIGVVSLWPRLVWSGPGRIAAGYCLFTLCCAAVPVVSADSCWAAQCLGVVFERLGCELAGVEMHLVVLLLLLHRVLLSCSKPHFQFNCQCYLS